jgi:hypothetical protein
MRNRNRYPKTPERDLVVMIALTHMTKIRNGKKMKAVTPILLGLGGWGHPEVSVRRKEESGEKKAFL